MSSIQALILSSDSPTVQTLKRAYSIIRVPVTVTNSTDDALVELSGRKIDAVLVDCDTAGIDFIQQLRNNRSNRTAIIFAFSVQDQQKRAFELGANFFLEKPLSVDRVMRAVRAAHALMARERRRYLRHELAVPVVLNFGNTREYMTETINISETGALLRTPQLPEMRGSLNVRIQLPGERKIVDVQARFISGGGERDKVAIQFVEFSAGSKHRFDEWMAALAEPRNSVSVPSRVG